MSDNCFTLFDRQFSEGLAGCRGIKAAGIIGRLKPKWRSFGGLGFIRLSAPFCPALADGAISDRSIKPRDRLTRRRILSSKLDQGFLHNVFGRCAPLPCKERQRRGVPIDQVTEMLRIHRD